MKYMHLELKVCEGCGMLWLRLKELRHNYCPGCTRRLASLPAPAGKRGGGRPRTRTATPRHVGCAAAANGRASSDHKTPATTPGSSQAGAR
jgi:hypothetical protein